MSDRRPPQPCDGCGQPSTPAVWGGCDVCECVAELSDLARTLPADQLRHLRARVLAALRDTEAQR